DQVGVI
ncbi:hypothetical protein LDH31_10930, partial [Mycobacterium tuberculosis]